ncbi:MAG: hypothetical protein ACFCA4_04255, partial [Cyanophyceae cyanobacterium]
GLLRGSNLQVPNGCPVLWLEFYVYAVPISMALFNFLHHSVHKWDAPGNYCSDRQKLLWIFVI